MNEHGSGKNPVECSLDGFSTVVRTYQDHGGIGRT